MADDRPPTLGWLCPYTPVEIPMAAGYLPVRLSGRNDLSGQRDPRIYHLLCPYVRAVFHRYADGKYPVPKKTVFVRSCDAMVRLYDLWRAYIQKDAILLDLPKVSSDEAVSYFSQVLRLWADHLSKDSPTSVTEDRLIEAIRFMNASRRFFSSLFHSLADGKAPFSYRWVHHMVRQWLERPSEQDLFQFQGQWEEAIRQGLRPASGIPVLLISTMLDQTALLDLLEDVGLQVVAEDECLGLRHLEESVREEGDPYRALAERYLTRWPCPRMKGSDERLERLEVHLERSNAKGIVVMQLKFCDQSAFDLPLILSRMKERGVPVLVVENDYGESGLGQMRTRLEAFAEMLDSPWD